MWVLNLQPRDRGESHPLRLSQLAAPLIYFTFVAKYVIRMDHFNPFQVRNSVAFSTFTLLRGCHSHPPSESFYLPKWKLSSWNTNFPIFFPQPGASTPSYFLPKDYFLSKTDPNWIKTKFVFKFHASEEEMKNELLLTGSVQRCCLFLKAQDTMWVRPQARATPTYLDNVCRLGYVFFKDQDGGGIDVDIVLSCHLFGPSQTHMYVSKWQVIFVCKSSQLLGCKREEELNFRWQDHTNQDRPVHTTGGDDS